MSAVVEILVTKQTSPSLIAGTLPGDAAGAMTTAIVGDTFIAQATLPTWTADALIWLAAVTILLMTARKTYRLVTVLPSPARQARQAAIWLALIMSEVVISLLAQARTALSIVVVTADDPVRVAQSGEGVILLICSPNLTHSKGALDDDLADKRISW